MLAARFMPCASRLADSLQSISSPVEPLLEPSPLTMSLPESALGSRPLHAVRQLAREPKPRQPQGRHLRVTRQGMQTPGEPPKLAARLCESLASRAMAPWCEGLWRGLIAACRRRVGPGDVLIRLDGNNKET